MIDNYSVIVFIIICIIFFIFWRIACSSMEKWKKKFESYEKENQRLIEMLEERDNIINVNFSRDGKNHLKKE